MSRNTWTPDALRSELRAYRGCGWRLVEAQHRVSTLKLVDSLDEQAVLEDILEASKPPVPAPCQGLDYLLATPFRYDGPYPHGSRFRRAGMTPGVWYGAEAVEAAVAEMVFYRFLFYAESPATPWPQNTADYTALGVRLATEVAVDLTAPPLVEDAALWTDPTSYAACQALEEAVRAAGGRLIRYQSVRDPDGRANLAVLDCAVFAEKAPGERQTWRIRLSQHGAQALCDFPDVRMSFGPDAFDDPRLSAMVWQR
ncbi:RES family NAD+ phosphorylase [uncultured Maritimibacter sp.]|uniref:RES family NAD+ phosphorylase n=1 Tax=uncultured Maritimibacter sp. TaxID=991866 RepID=UPI000A4F688E|nr:RES family NAD+ phosphorylase [uncultured Maritimibacter sp.]